MDRFRHKKTVIAAGIAILSGALLASEHAFARTVLLPPPIPREANLPASETFPESSFGHEPARARDDGSAYFPEKAERSPASAQNTAHEAGHAGASEPDPSVARRGVQEVALIASDLGYFPKTIFVSRDIPVRLFVTGSSKNTLCIMMDAFAVRKQVRSQRVEEIQFVPNQPGMYRFYCPVNGMEGTLVVKDLSSN